MKNRILKKKLMFIFHIVNHRNSSLTSEVLQMQKTMELPGLWPEVIECLKDLEIDEDNLVTQNKI